MARIERLIHEGRPIIHLDLRSLKPGEFVPVFEEVMKLLSRAPKGTARVVTDVEGARFDPLTLIEFERFIREASPLCAANAVVGVTGIRLVAWQGVRRLYQCPVQLCPTVQAGKDWLARFTPQLKDQLGMSHRLNQLADRADP